MPRKPRRKNSCTATEGAILQAAAGMAPEKDAIKMEHLRGRFVETYKAPHKLELNAGKKWGTDDALRKAMSGIQTSVTQTLPAAHAGKASAADYDAFGKDVTAQVTYMVENCKLDPQADAQLHIIVADL